ncbi:MAG: pyrroline-5-carboxylate reductase [Planctomycetota bacterium]
MQPRLVIVGAGNVGQALVRGAVLSGLAAPSEIAVVDTDPARVAESVAQGLRAADEEAVASCDILLLAVKPQQFEEAARPIAAALRRHAAGPGPIVASVMAGIRADAIRAALGPALRVVRAMPNTPAGVRRGITAIASDSGVDAASVAQVEQLFASVGRTVRVEERLFDAVTAVSGSGPAFVFRFLEAWASAAEELGLPSGTAEALARETLIGAAALLDETKERPEVLRAKVTSKGGTTAAGLARMDDATARPGGIDGLLSETLRAARDRGAELGR